MDMSNMGTQPTIEGLNQLEAAVLMEKYTILLGMINFGSPEQRKQAKDELKVMEGYIHSHVNGMTFETANNNMGFTEEELEFIEQPIQ
ncbi:hypothetical protein ACFPOG_12460 [Paenibacillus aestuarii]|uniref:Spore coat protein n=1 Tax=Paenibacillus aestuarii TaxID=516965 RepID=A0ABW0K8G2_9BACL